MAFMNTLFSLKKKRPCREKYLVYILFLKINDLVIKLFHILRLTVLYIYLSVVSPIVLFDQLFDARMISHYL